MTPQQRFPALGAALTNSPREGRPKRQQSPRYLLSSAVGSSFSYYMITHYIYISIILDCVHLTCIVIISSIYEAFQIHTVLVTGPAAVTVAAIQQRH